jgi:hypothetical protein
MDAVLPIRLWGDGEVETTTAATQPVKKPAKTLEKVPVIP